MAKEYSDNRQTIGISNVIGSEEVPPDVVDGWRIRSKDSKRESSRFRRYSGYRCSC